MIRSFACKETEKIWAGVAVRRLPRDIQDRALRKLRQLNAALTLDDLRLPPSNHLEVLSGKLKGQMSLRINDQWRICFVWLAGDVFDVVVRDYH